MTPFLILALLLVVGIVVRKIILSRKPRQLKDGDPIPLLKLKGRPDAQVWFVSWLANVRRVKANTITGDTAVTAEEVQAGIMSAVFQYRQAFACGDMLSIRTVREFVEMIEAQMTMAN